MLICSLFCYSSTFLMAQRPPEDSTKVVSDSLYLDYDQSLDQLASVKADGHNSALDQILNKPIGIAAKKEVSPRHSAGVVSIITREEIQQSGARDLIDVLRNIPGFTFGQDSRGRVGPGLRGNWANEGKMLLLIDGQEMNDIYSATLSFGNHYPVDFIQHIEIIRGPGSAVYGGFAEFGVINIVTLSGEEFSGMKANFNYGWMQDRRSRRNRYFYIGKTGKNVTINYFNYHGRAQRSDQEHYAFFSEPSTVSPGKIGEFVSLEGRSELQPRFNNFFVRWKNLSFRSIVDFYKLRDVTLLDDSLNLPVKEGIRSAYTELKYEWQIGDRLKLTPSYHGILQFPEFSGLPDSLLANQSDNKVYRNRLKVNADFDLSHRVNLQGGVDLFRDFAKSSTRVNFFPVGDASVTYLNFASWFQGIFQLPWGNLTAGVRYDWNSEFGDAFTPRFALTEKWNKFHIKLLANGAFRAPSIGNVALFFDGTYQVNSDSTGIRLNRNSDIEPEYTISFEAELGYQPNEKLYISANVFDNTTYNPIVLSAFQDPELITLFGPQANLRVYTNEERSGTRGFEFDLRLKDRWGYLNANYGFYTSRGKQNPIAYQVSTFDFDANQRTQVEDDLLLGFPQHRINVVLNTYLNRSKNLSLNISGNYYSQRYSYDILRDPSLPFDSGELIQEEPHYLVNVFLKKDHFLIRNLNLGLGIYDVLNERPRFLQPYFGLQPPLAGPSREIVFTLSYGLNFANGKEN